MDKTQFHLVIDSENNSKRYLKDLVRCTELFGFLAWRNILVRYRQAFFGVAWALLKPLLTMLFFSLIFGSIAHLPSDGVNYSLFVFAGMLPWLLFSNSIVESSESLVNQSTLVSKTYFPRLLIPASQIAVHIIDFSIGLLFFTILCLFYGEIHFSTLLFLPLFILLALLLCLGGALWLSAATVQYRDFRFITPFLIQFGIFVSPVGYASFLIPDKWIFLYVMNPLVGIIDGFRWAFFGIAPNHFTYSLITSSVVTLFTLVTGFAYFRKMEKTFADKI